MKKTGKQLLGMAILILAVVLSGCYNSGGKISDSESTGEPIRQQEHEKSGEPLMQNTQTVNQGAGDDEKFFFQKPQQVPDTVHIKILKQKRILELYGDDIQIGAFPIALGWAPEDHKEKEGDGRTPEGIYYICTRNDRSRFTLFLGLSYPGREDAERGLQQEMISRAEYNQIIDAVSAGKRPPWETALGGVVGIHGGGSERDWTAGCIALSDEDIRILWKYVPMGTKVEIVP